MVSGLRFLTCALLRLAFASAPHFLLNLARLRNSPVHSSIGTPSTLLLSGLRLLVNIRFQVLFHSPPGVLFTFPSWYYALSVDICVLPWRVVPPASHGISRVPRYSGAISAFLFFAYQAFTVFGPRFVYGSQALPWQPARSRLPCGTQNDSLSAAAFLP